MKQIFFFFTMLLFTTAISRSNTILIPADYSTIQNGINAANSFDTILVSPGTYSENLNFNGKSIVLKSTDGAEVTTLAGIVAKNPVIYVTTGELKGTAIEGFTITGGDRSAIYVKDAVCDVRDNIITGNHNNYNFSGGGIWLEGSVGSKIERNIFFDNQVGNFGGGIYVNNGSDSDTLAYNILYNNNGNSEIYTWSGSSNIIIYNNTVTGNGSGIFVRGSAYIYNNLVFGLEGAGIYDYSGYATIDYNCLYDNKYNIWLNPGTTVGSNNLYEEGELRNYFQHDFTLLPYSPCIDAGDPSAFYNDPDGSRNDIGALPYVEFSPAATLLSLGRFEPKDHIVWEPPHFCFHYFDSLTPMTAARIEVDTSYEFSGVPYWASGDILPMDTCVDYGGVPLEDSVTYFYRIQVSDGTSWSDWSVNFFRMNAKPMIPVLHHPTALEFISNTNVNLIIESSYDSEGDTITYDFEISEDINFSVLTDYRYGVPHNDSLTASGLFYGFPPAVRYYWRSRAFDGYEYSDWSDTESFITKSPATIRVPDDYSTIQAAINAATELDSIKVAPGTYTGPGNRDLNFNGKNLILVSDSGADLTIIDCGGTDVENHYGFLFESGEDTTSVVDGFTITNAYLDWGSAITVNNYTRLTLKNCKIDNNHGNGMTTSWGDSPIYIDRCEFTNNTMNGLRAWYYPIVTNSFFAYNGWSGAHFEYYATVRNCTFVYNDLFGINLEGTAPKNTASPESPNGILLTNNISAYNQDVGIFIAFVFTDSMNCNTSFGNSNGNWSYWLPSEPNYGNDSLNPMFCDPNNGDFRLQNESPCLPANNECNQLRGAYQSCDYTSCCLGIRGNVDYDVDDGIDIADLVYFVVYGFQGGPAPPCFEEADVNGDLSLDIGDVVYLVQYIFLGGNAPTACP